MMPIRRFLNGLHDTTMFLTLMLWLCVAPFVLLLTLPFFGWQGGVTAVIATFLIALALCWGVCVFPKNSTEVNSNVNGFSQVVTWREPRSTQDQRCP